MKPGLKPFVLNLDDLNFIYQQVTFRPLYDASGNLVFGWDGTQAIYDSSDAGTRVLLSPALDPNSATFAADFAAAVDAYGQSYASTTDLSGLRDVSGLNNNLLPVHSTWGSVDQAFVRTVQANFDSYSQQDTTANPASFQNTNGGFAAIDWDKSTPGVQSWSDVGANYTTTVDSLGAVTQSNVVDYTPRMISRTVTTGGVTMLTEGQIPGYSGTTPNHIVYNTPFLSDGVTANPNYNPAAVEGVALVSDYGLLADPSVGHIDYQNPASGEYFIGAENPGVAPTNGWFALFGQFFDHGLDLIGKGGQGTTIKIALAADDPLYGVLGPDGQPVTSITIGRATVSGKDANGDPTYINHTSPFIDQSQTYGSHEQMTTLLRAWVSNDGGATFHAGMELFDGDSLEETWTRPDGVQTHQTLPTLNELRNHVLATGRDALTWEDVLDYRNRDATGQVSTGNSGQSLILDMNPRFDTAHLLPADDQVPTTAGGPGVADAMLALGLSFDGNGNLSNGSPGGTGFGALMAWVNPSTFAITAPAGPVHDAVSAILMAAVGDHYIAGDGRVNENFGLTAIHHVFHEEHNFQIQNVISTINAQDAAVSPATHEELHRWQIDTGTTDANGNFTHGVGGPIAWDQDKMFNAAKLIVEMEYQHAAVDQYARTITPHILEVVGYSSGIDSTISLEYSQSAFRFGHSTIRETIDTIDPNQGLTGKIMSFALEKAFLNPALFAAEGPAAIALGMSHQQMNEVDEFITPALNQGLLGQPLDLAAINIARGRDIGIPTLNEFRGKVGLTQYTSWDDFGHNMIHPQSLVNFIAAYAFDGDIARAQAIVGLFDGSIAEGTPEAMGYTADQALAFMYNDTGTPVAGADAFNLIDTWIGGLAEAHVPGGLLGSTFDLVFVNQIENLINGDRFYYLVRLFGEQFGEEVNNGQFKDIVERNTGLTHLNGSVFAYADQYYDLGANDSGDDLPGDVSHKSEHKYGEILAANPTLGVWSDGSINPNSINTNGTIITVGGVQYIRDFRPDLAPDNLHPVEGTPTSGADSHEVMVGTDRSDFLHMRSGDDTAYGEGGNDKIFGDFGNDRLYGGDGNDTIDSGDGADLVDGGAGDDLIYGYGSGTEIGGFDQLVGGDGDDTIYGGEGIDKLSGGAGDDALYGEGNTDPFSHGGDGNDLVDGGTSGDNLYGDAGDDLVIGGDDQDIVEGDSGDDILRPGRPSQAINGGPDEVIGGDGYTDTGFDLMDLSDYDPSPTGVDCRPGHAGQPAGRDRRHLAVPSMVPDRRRRRHAKQRHANRNRCVDGSGRITLFGGSNWLIGGSGNDSFTGAGGNDVIVGGSIRLDALIGKYVQADGTTPSAYNTYDAYSGASHRIAATDTLTAGLLGAAALTGDFDKHFTEFLKSARFKDFVLGDGGTDGNTDKVVLTGNKQDYTVLALDANGNVIADALSALGSIFALRLTDNGGLNLDGTVRTPSDGTDLVMGVERFQFSDGTKTLAQLFNSVPTGTVGFTATEDPGGVTNNENAIRLSPNNSIADADGVIPPITYAWQNNAGVAISTTASNTNPYVDGSGRLVLRTTAGTLVRELATYADGNGTTETVSKTWNMIVGTSGNNAALTGTASTANSDAIFGLDGNDTLSGLAGDDRLFGGSGSDTLSGGDGNDELNGGSGADAMTGGAGDDTYVVDDSNPTGGIDVVIEGAGAGTGTDTVLSSVNYTLTADVENLTLTGNSNINGNGNGLDNLITGNSGNNTLAGGLGNDTYRAGLNGGNDAINETGGAADRIAILTGGTALSSLSFSDNNTNRPGGGLVVNFNGQQIIASGHFDAGMAGDIEFVNFENGSFAGYQFGAGDYSISTADPTGLVRTVSVSTGNNVLAGETGSDNLTGGTGNDLLFGAGGTDTLNGGAGADLLAGGTGGDTINGGTGDDVIVVDIDGGNTGADIIAGGANVDTLAIVDTGTGGESLSVNYDGTRITQIEGSGSIAADVENVTANLGAGSDTIVFTTTAAVTVNLALGTASGFVSIAGIENVTGGSGADLLTGGAGNNTLTGGGGDDTFTVDDTGDSVSESNGTAGGIDTVRALINAYTISDSDVENLTFAGTGNFTGTGNGSANVITGGAGDDQITGGGGADLLNGGLGSDVFRYNSVGDFGAGVTIRDIIQAFSSTGLNNDVVNLNAIDANTGSFGNQNFVLTSGSGSGAFTAAGQIHIEQIDTNGDLTLNSTLIQANTTGISGAEMEILLQGYTGTLTPANFVF